MNFTRYFSSYRALSLLIALFFSSLLVPLMAQTWRKPIDLGGNYFTGTLHDIHMLDANTGWAVGQAGVILKTTNGGSSWTPQTSGTTNTLQSVYFSDANTGWAVGSGGVILKTTNGGSSWTPQTSGTINNLWSVYFSDANTGWAVGQGGVILKTTNGGSSWTPQTSGTTNWLRSVYFSDANTGWAVGDGGVILKTTNGGSSWTPQTSGTTNILYSVYFSDANTGWAVGQGGVILKTTNGGSSWTPQTSGTTNWLRSVYFSDANTGWAVGQAGVILKTTNGGSSWTPQTSGTTNWLYSVYFSDANTGWAVGQAGVILKTTNGGSSWTPQTSGTTNILQSVYFSDANTGWAVGDGGVILKTTNGGSSWTPQTSGTTNILYSVYFSDANTGWAVGQGGVILKTTNGGSSWTPQTSGTTSSLYSVYFSDANTGWAVGFGGVIRKTTNGGSSWTPQTSGTTNNLWSVYFSDANTGWAVGVGGVILLTTGVSVSASSATLCTGVATSLSASVGGFSPTTYTWSSLPSGLSGSGPNVTFMAPSVVSPTTYTLTVTATNGSITETGSATVLVNPAPNRLYVRATATGANTGLDWDNAFTNLQSALNYSCSGNLTEIWVAAGTYYPDEGPGQTNNARSSAFLMKNGVSILGGFPAIGDPTLSDRAPASFATILSGDLDKNNVLDGNNAYHVISNQAGLTTTAVLDGFVITAGNADGSNADGRGGGVYNDGSGSNNTCNPSFRNCSLQGNRADFGGAIFNNGSNSGQSSPTLINCSFQNNSATTYGGAIYSDGSFSGSSSPSLINCSFLNNTTQFGYGRVFYNKASSMTLVNTIIWNNGLGNPFYQDNSPVIQASYCLIDANVNPGDYTTSGPGNLTTTTSPFASETSVALNACSPAINTGNKSATGLAGITTDLAGNPRIFNNNRVDMGAVEFQGDPVSITAQLASGSAVCEGATVTASVSVSGTGPFTYQWYKGSFSTPVASQTAATLSLTNVTATDAGSYSVVVNGICSATSSGFNLTVDALSPTLTSAQLCMGTTVSLTATGGVSYTLSPGNVINVNGFFAVSPSNTTTYTVSVVNLCGSVASTTATVTVNDPPTVSLSTTDICVGVASLSVSSNQSISQLQWYNGSNLAFTALPPFKPTGTVAGGNGQGSDANQLSSPDGVYVDAQGAVYVADANNHRIQKWVPGASSGITVAGGNGQGNDADQLSYPFGVYVDGQGAVYVADANNHRIQKWVPGASSGITVAGGNGQGNDANQLSYPVDVYVDSQGAVYVADRDNNRIQKWIPGASSGITVAGGNGQGSDANQFTSLYGVYVDAQGAVYVADQGNHRIQKWVPGASSGITVAGRNGNGSGANQLSAPLGVYVDRQGAVYVADAGNHRIQKWAPEPVSPVYVPTAPGSYSVRVTAITGCTAVTSTLEVNAAPTFTLSNVNLCERIPVNLTATGGTSYTLNPGGLINTTGVFTVNPASTTTYTLTAQNASGCVASTRATVTVNSAPTGLALAASNSAGVASSTLTCAVPSLTLTAAPTGSYTYAFGSGANQIGTGNTATVNAPGVYTLTVTDVNGCSSFTTTEVFSETTTVTVSLASSNTLNCVLSSATLTATAMGVGSLTYVFTGGGLSGGASSNSTVTVNGPGTYTVRVTDVNGCTQTATTEVVSNTTAPDQVSLTASNSGTLTCAVQTLTLTATPTTGYTYAFSSGATQVGTGNTATVNAPGTYSVLTTNVHGCTATANTEVVSNTTTPTVSLASSNSLNCTTTSSTLTASASGVGSLTYAFGGGALSGNPSTNSMVTVNAPGTYTILVTDVNGCTATATTTVASDTALPSNLSLTSGTLTCAQTNLTLTASATNGTSFTFSGGTKLGNNQVVVTQAGPYSVTVSNANGCTTSTTVTVGSNTTVPSVSISPSVGLLTCTTTSLTLTANTDAASRRWSDGSTGPTLIVSASGTYGLSVTATNGCTASASPVSINQDLSALAGLALGSSSPAFGCGGGTITLTATPAGATQYRFAGPSLTQTGGQQTALATRTGTYSVTATKGICTATASISLGGTVGTPPNALLVGNGSLSCQTPTLSLTAVGGTYYTITGPGVVSQSDGSEAIIVGSYIINRRPIPTVGMAIVNKPGTYTVLVTDEKGCTATASILVTGTECPPPR